MAMLILSELFAYSSAAKNAVTVVPMLAPMMNGAACFNFTIFFATIGTTTDDVMVLDRIAAVVMRPHVKDFSGLLKKNLLKASGNRAFNKFEINLRKMRIDANNNTSASAVRKKGLGITSIKKLMMG